LVYKKSLDASERRASNRPALLWNPPKMPMEDGSLHQYSFGFLPYSWIGSSSDSTHDKVSFCERVEGYSEQYIRIETRQGGVVDSK
jgi:hypothetical protein